MNIQTYFSPLDKYETLYDSTKKIMTLYLSTECIQYRNVYIHPALQHVCVEINYQTGEYPGDVSVIGCYTSMLFDKEENQVATPCPICGCSVEQMKIEQDDELVDYIHSCSFSEESVAALVSDIDFIDITQYDETFYENIIHDSDTSIPDPNGFLIDGVFYTLRDNKVYHYHFHEEDVYCEYCSQSEPYENEGIIYQLCPVLTKYISKIKEALAKKR